MSSIIWSILEQKLRSGSRSIENCHAIGLCIRFLHRHSTFSNHPYFEKQFLKHIRQQFPTVRGLTAAFLAECLDIAKVMQRKDAWSCRSITISHYRELRYVASEDAVRELLLDASRRNLTCRKLRKEAAVKEVEIRSGIPSQDARFVAEIEEACNILAAARKKLQRSQIALGSVVGQDRQYLNEKFSTWRQELRAIEQDMFDHATEMRFGKRSESGQDAA